MLFLIGAASIATSTERLWSRQGRGMLLSSKQFKTSGFSRRIERQRSRFRRAELP
jgi:hypothetical protein